MSPNFATEHHVYKNPTVRDAKCHPQRHPPSHCCILIQRINVRRPYDPVGVTSPGLSSLSMAPTRSLSTPARARCRYTQPVSNCQGRELCRMRWHNECIDALVICCGEGGGYGVWGEGFGSRGGEGLLLTFFCSSLRGRGRVASHNLSLLCITPRGLGYAGPLLTSFC